MPFLLRLWHILLICLAGWISRRQQETIEYLQAENQILKQKLGKKRIYLSNAQRRRLAIKGKVVLRQNSICLKAVEFLAPSSHNPAYDGNTLLDRILPSISI